VFLQLTGTRKEVSSSLSFDPVRAARRLTAATQIGVGLSAGARATSDTRFTIITTRPTRPQA
jgi:hypothetical protein